MGIVYWVLQESNSIRIPRFPFAASQFPGWSPQINVRRRLFNLIVWEAVVNIDHWRHTADRNNRDMCKVRQW